MKINSPCDEGIKSRNKSNKKVITVIASCIAALAVVITALWLFYTWGIINGDLLTTEDYTLSVNKIMQEDITLKVKNDGTYMYFDGIESDYAISDEQVDILSELGYVYQIVVSSDKYSIDELYGDETGREDELYLEIYQKNISKLKRHKNPKKELFFFGNLTAIYTSSPHYILIWRADK